MTSLSPAASLLAHEASSLMERVGHLRPFSLQVPMVTAATLSPQALAGIEGTLRSGRRAFRRRARGFLRWLLGPEGRRTPACEAQRRYTVLRLCFNQFVTEYDLFADALAQRSEHGLGVLLGGLDVVAADALSIEGRYFEPPPLLCYLDQGMGAAIRRARTRLPTGRPNPAAIIRIPRERMVGTGIAASLFHEVGHQGAALLGLVPSLRAVIGGLARRGGPLAPAWSLWGRWLSEVVADFWAVARVGVASPLGLMSVVSLPRWFVFRINVDDPHPTPWIRMKLACAVGGALYPHPQWARLAAAWEDLYPPAGVGGEAQELLRKLESTLGDFAAVLVNHRPEALRGSSLGSALASEDRSPARLARMYQAWRAAPAQMYAARPTHVFAALGQARADGRLSAEAEGRTLTALLEHWALRSAIDTSLPSGARSPVRAAELEPRVRRGHLVAI